MVANCIKAPGPPCHTSPLPTDIVWQTPPLEVSILWSNGWSVCLHRWKPVGCLWKGSHSREIEYWACLLEFGNPFHMLLRNMSCVAIRNWFPVTIFAVIAFFIITRFSNSLPRGVYRVCMCSAECNWTIYVLCICEYYTVGLRLYITRHIIMSMSCMFTSWYVCSMYVCLYVILSFSNTDSLYRHLVAVGWTRKPYWCFHLFWLFVLSGLDLGVTSRRLCASHIDRRLAKEHGC